MSATAATLIALLGLSTLTASEHIIDRAIDARDIQRRSVPSLGNATNNTLPSPLSASFVEGCVAYNCFCHSDTSGNPFDPDSGCFPKDCKFGRAQGETFECQCAWMGCDCDSQYLMQGTGMKCGECAPGMILYGNHCYMNTDTSVVTAIVLVLGIALIVAMIATCYSLGGMDPGRDSIIYRLTTQRIKAQ